MDLPYGRHEKHDVQCVMYVWMKCEKSVFVYDSLYNQNSVQTDGNLCKPLAHF